MSGSVYEGKTYDEAVRKGLEALRLTRAEAVITTIEEGKGGFLGLGSRPFRVSVSRRPGGAIREPAERPGEERRGGKRGGRRDEPAGRARAGGREERAGRGAQGPRDGRGGRATGGREERAGRSARASGGEPGARGAQGTREPRPEREGRAGRGGRPGRPGRPERVAAEERPTGDVREAREAREPRAPARERPPQVREEREGREVQPREERVERRPSPAQGATPQQPAIAHDEGEDAQRKRRRRGRRGGRGRRRGGPGGAEGEGVDTPGLNGMERVGSQDAERGMVVPPSASEPEAAEFERDDEFTAESPPETLSHATVAAHEPTESRDAGGERHSRRREEAEFDPGARGRGSRGERSSGPDMTPDELSTTSKRLTEELLAAMGFEPRVSVRAEGNRVDVTVEVDRDDDLLNGRQGETRQALQHLLNRFLNKGDGSRYHLQLEVNDFWQRRETELADLARRLAEEAVTANAEVVSDYLNSQERRIVHMTLKEDARVKTFSLGAGMVKRVAVAPAGFPDRTEEDPAS